ncbi:uncharacterized protein LOC131423786 [Marmota monax]|uniref:uncharacterized protein LOC131423786 n=1 Tax=Marmota monax TaxID=9995 RepID=UPI0026ED204A|nr:uncharacterized protein LOC131423786 [Marmota monax]
MTAPTIAERCTGLRSPQGRSLGGFPSPARLGFTSHSLGDCREQRWDQSGSPRALHPGGWSGAGDQAERGAVPGGGGASVQQPRASALRHQPGPAPAPRGPPASPDPMATPAPATSPEQPRAAGFSRCPDWCRTLGVRPQLPQMCHGRQRLVRQSVSSRYRASGHPPAFRAPPPWPRLTVPTCLHDSFHLPVLAGMLPPPRSPPCLLCKAALPCSIPLFKPVAAPGTVPAWMEGVLDLLGRSTDLGVAGFSAFLITPTEALQTLLLLSPGGLEAAGGCMC